MRIIGCDFHPSYQQIAGQVASMMRQLRAEPIATDFNVFLAERRR